MDPANGYSTHDHPSVQHYQVQTILNTSSYFLFPKMSIFLNLFHIMIFRIKFVFFQRLVLPMLLLCHSLQQVVGMVTQISFSVDGSAFPKKPYSLTKVAK